MATLQEILESDFGIGSEKTAAATGFGGDADLEKVASELGLFGDAQPATNAAPASSEKVASIGGLDGLYNELFPDDVDLGTEKVAEEEKLAGEELLGAMSYDAFAERFDRRIEKIATEVLNGDSRPEQSLPDNRPADAGSGIDTASQVTNILPPQTGGHVVGDEQKGRQEKAAAALAFRKHLLLANLAG